MDREAKKNGSQLGLIYTFYSYKGGVGRSMAVANVGALLALEGFKVLLLDWDLEAPGLEAFFQGKKNCHLDGKVENTPGIIDLLVAKSKGSELDWKRCLIPTRLSGFTLDFISAGQRSRDYRQRVQSLDWGALFDQHDVGNYLEALRNEMKSEYDFILIDSRTGITDIGDICTVLMPDHLVTLFVSNQQNIDGCKAVIRRAQEARQNLPVNRSKMIVIPVPCRDESDSEYDEASRWRSVFETNFSEQLLEWLPKEIEPSEYFNRMYIPYIPIWSFGERLPILESRRELHDPKTIGASYLALTRLLKDRLDWYSVFGESKKETIQSAAIELQLKNQETRNLQKANDRLQLGIRSVMFVAAILLTLASGYTTFNGLSEYTFGFAIPALITVGLHSLLFTISWWLAVNWRRGWSSIVAGGIIFFMCAAVSIFFSVSTFYQSINTGRSNEASLSWASSTVATLVDDLARKLQEQIVARSSGIASGLPGSSWSSSVKEIAELAEGATGELAQAAQEQLQDLNRELANTERSLLETEIQRGATGSERELTQAKLIVAGEQMAQIQETIVATRRQISELQDLIASETRTRDTEAVTGGCGAICRDIEAKIRRYSRDLELMNAELSAALITAQSIQEQEETQAQELKDIDAQMSLILAELTTIDARRRELNSAIEFADASSQDGRAPDLLRALVAEFEAQNFANFDIAVENCLSLSDLLVATNVTGTDTLPNCIEPVLNQNLQELDDLKKRAELFQRNCSRTIVQARSFDLSGVINFGSECITLSEFVDDETDVMRKTLERVSQLADIDALPVAKLQLAIFEIGDPLAYFSLAIATVIDLLVLLTALTGTSFGRRRGTAA